MYCVTNYKTKKALLSDVKLGLKVEVIDVSPFARGRAVNGKVSLEGPHSPAAHTWYAQAVVKDNIIVTVK